MNEHNLPKLRQSILSSLLVATVLLAGDRSQAQQMTNGISPQFYSHGEPTNDEQYVLERLNRARLDPVGEGQRLADWLRNTPVGRSVVGYYHTNPDQVAADFAALPAVAPLGFDPALLTSARRYADDLAVHGGAFPAAGPHVGWDGSTPDQRVWEAGYRDADGEDGFGGECGASSSRSVDEIHAGYLIDWGNPGLGHRYLRMNSAPYYRQVGIGLATVPAGGSYSYGNLEEAEDYGVTASETAFLLGVVYTDRNANGLYDVGEGVAGATVTVEGGAYYTVTSASGGYAVLLKNADGTSIKGAFAVHLTGLAGGAVREAALTVHTLNIKWDAVVNAVVDGATATLAGGGPVSRSAKGMVKLLVKRPSGDDASAPLEVPLAFKGAAVAGVDYQPLPSTVTIPAKAESYKLKVKALGGNASNNAAPATLTIKVRGAKGAQTKATVTFVP